MPAHVPKIIAVLHGCHDRNGRCKRTPYSVKRLFIILLLAALTACLSGCNTMRGMGRDIEALGRYIQDASE